MPPTGREQTTSLVHIGTNDPGHENPTFEMSEVATSGSSSPSSRSNKTEDQDQTTIEFSSLASQLSNPQMDQPRAGHDGQLSRNLVEALASAQVVEALKSATGHFDVEPAAKSAPAGSQFTISWQNLDYVVCSKWWKLTKGRKPILTKLSGSFKSGELSAVLGPSGAGKSTLIDCLLGKRESGTNGRTLVTFDDPEREAERRRRKRPLRIATIPQEDHLLDSLTVTETFMFASRIKNAHLNYMEMDDEEEEQDGSGKPLKRRPFDHFANVQRVIQQLKLSSCAGTRCGKLSGGQYKRVSIGQELLSRPELMILDEPTSGLDSVTCYQTISALRQLIESSPYPLAIVATIHQPDVEVFNLFHKAYVLASGGRPIYEGPTGEIFESVRLGVELVEARRKRRNEILATSGSGSSEDPIKRLKSQLDGLVEASEKAVGLNPARLVVQVAAGEFGFEITSAMNELQALQSQHWTRPLDSPISMDPREGDVGGSSSCSTSPDNMDLRSESVRSLVRMATEPTDCRPVAPAFDYETNAPGRRRAHLDKLLSCTSSSLATTISDRSNGADRPSRARVFFRHLMLHTRRSWLTILRDPMLFSLQLLLHIMVPLLISYSFGWGTARRDACPRVGPLDVVDEAFSPTNILEELNLEIRQAFENLGYMFFQIYVIIFAAVCVTSLTYPLVMHVLLKEYRNGWYSLSSYFLGRTLADLPVPTVNVVIAMAISYHLTGQPLSPHNWRFVSVAALTVLATLVAQTQGLMFGALLMNAPQSAVFVAPASTAPLVVVSGFLLRITSLPKPLQLLSQFSYFTHLLNGFIISRYGFNRCPCDPEDFSIDRNHQIPSQARGIIDIWVESFAPDYNLTVVNNTLVPNDNTIGDSRPVQPVDLIGKLLDTVNRAKTFGHNIEECDQVKPFTMLDYELKDSDLLYCFVALLSMLVICRWLTYITLTWKIRSCI